MEKLIFLVVIVIITALHNWWQKRRGEPEVEETDDQPWSGAPAPSRPPPPPGSSPTPARPKATNWEEELRRLLEGETVTRPRPVPPVVVTPPPPPLPAAPRPRPKAQPAAPPPFLARSSIPVPEEGHEEEAGLPVRMPSLEQSAQAFLRARTLDARVTNRLKQVSQAVQTHPKFSNQRSSNAAISQGVALLRYRQSQRAAIIAAVILGPPKALEELNRS